MDQRNRKVTNHDVKPWSTLWDAFEKLDLSQSSSIWTDFSGHK
jgi:hypothetical protein